MNLNRYSSIFILIWALLLSYSCKKEASTEEAIVTSLPIHLNSVIDDGDVSCTTDGNSFFSCSRDNSFPFDGASLFYKDIELSFANISGKGTMISPADRHYFNLWTYTNALTTTFMTTGILSADFDTIRTDYIFQDYSPGDYYLTLASGMNCVFFRCANGNYGLIKFNSVVGAGVGSSSITVNFAVKYVEKNN